MKTIIPKKAFVLAAGRGTRLGQLTESMPKCLITVCGKPLLAYQLEKLRDSGVKQVCINLHHKSDQVRAFIGESLNPGLEISFSDEPELLDTGGALKKASWFFSSDEPFFVVNADILTDFPLESLASKWSEGALGVFACRERVESSRLTLDSAGSVDALRMVTPPYSANTRAFSGISLYSPQLVSLIRAEKKDIFSIKDIWKKTFLPGSPKFYTTDIPPQNYWFDIGTPESLGAARALLER